MYKAKIGQIEIYVVSDEVNPATYTLTQTNSYTDDVTQLRISQSEMEALVAVLIIMVNQNKG